VSGAEEILSRLGADAALAAMHGQPAEAPWEPPVPLGTRAALPDFPVGELPAWLADQVSAVAEFTQTPPDLAGCTALACLSTAAGGRAVVEVRRGWREPVNLYLVVVLPPGSRKSAVFRAMTEPVLDAEQQLADKTKAQIIEAEVARRIAARAAERATQAAAAATGDHQAHAIAEASAAALAAEAIQAPVLPRLVADDVTPEAATSLLAEQGGRLAVLSAEGGIFATLAGRYSASGPNLEVFLKGHAGDMLRVDRKGRPAEHIPHPALTLGLAIQPEVLTDIARMPGFRGRGLLARLLYALPENTVGRRKIGAPPVPELVAEAYAASLQALVTSLAEWTDPAVLPLTPEANDAVLAIEEAIEPRLAPGTGDFGQLADWGSKLTGAVIRIAGVLHLAAHLRDGWGKPVTTQTIASARSLGEYFAAHALAAFDQMGADPRLEDARTVHAWIERTRPEQFTRRDAFRAMPRGRFRKVTDLDPALDILEQHGWIRLRPAADHRGPGRPPSPVYDVHPDLTQPASRILGRQSD
jgi:replicative DNA helicase